MALISQIFPPLFADFAGLVLPPAIGKALVGLCRRQTLCRCHVQLLYKDFKNFIKIVSSALEGNQDNNQDHSSFENVFFKMGMYSNTYCDMVCGFPYTNFYEPDSCLGFQQVTVMPILLSNFYTFIGITLTYLIMHNCDLFVFQQVTVMHKLTRSQLCIGHSYEWSSPRSLQSSYKIQYYQK